MSKQLTSSTEPLTPSGHTIHQEFDRLARMLGALTWLRAAELLGGRWEEINLAKREWIIPAARMKSGQADHVVPLSPEAIMVLVELRELSGDYLEIFPFRHHMTILLQKTRAAAFVIVTSTGLFSLAAMQQQLNHSEGGEPWPADLEERRRMMDWWGAHLGGEKPSVSELLEIQTLGGGRHE